MDVADEQREAVRRFFPTSSGSSRTGTASCASSTRCCASSATTRR